MSPTPAYPLFLDLSQKPVLVVGGGAVGLRKVRGLLECGARVTVVSPLFSEGFSACEGVVRVRATYAAGHMTRRRWRLVFAATDQPAVNAQVQRQAAAAGIWCCRCDEPEAGDFSGGAVRRAGSVTFAVSSGGASPGLAARVCDQALEKLDPVLSTLADLLAQWRPAVKAAVATPHIRRELLRRLAGEELETILRQQGVTAARRAGRQWLAAAQRAAAPRLLSPPTPAEKSGKRVRHHAH